MPYRLKTREKHFLTAIFFSTFPICILFVFFTYARFFSGSNDVAIALLGTLVQSSSALAAIVFAFLIFISQTVIGKYVSGTLDYIFNYRSFMVTFTFYISATATISLAMWLFSIFYWNAFVDVSFTLFIIEILLLPFLFFFQSKLLSPKILIDTLLAKANLAEKKTRKETMEQIMLVFSTIYKLAENKEYDNATYGLKAVTNLVTSNPNKEDLGFYLWAVPNYERIGVECFRFDPNISANVTSQLFELVNHLNKASSFILANACSRIASASFNIASAVAGKPYAENTLVGSYFLLQEIYVSKSMVDYGFSAYDELFQMAKIIKMMEESNVPTHLMTGFSLQFNCEKLIKAQKYEMAESLIIGTLNAFPKNDYVLQEYVNLIFFAIPLDKKEIADRIIEEMKTKFGQLEIQFTRTSDPSRSEIGVRDGVISVKAGSDEISEKIGWFKKTKKSARMRVP
jgi:hypothetical protein